MTRFSIEDYRPRSPTELVLGACALLGCSPDPSCEVSARLLGRAETLAHVNEDLIDLVELADLESALGEYIYEHGGRTTFHALDFDGLAEIVGSALICRVVLHRLGYFQQPRGDRVIWSNRPADGNIYRMSTISFVGVNRYIPGRGFSRGA